MRAETVPWWRQAEADLYTAEVNMAAGQFYAVSWFAQQAAEKALKALHVERHQQLASRTHDLTLLGARLDVPGPVEADLENLNPAFDLARYPDDQGLPPVDAVDKQRATSHIDAARRIVAWVSSEIS